MKLRNTAPRFEKIDQESRFGLKSTMNGRHDREGDARHVGRCRAYEREVGGDII